MSHDQLGLSGRLIQAAIRFFPEAHRDEFGPDLLAAFFDLRSDAIRNRGAFSRGPVVAWITLRTAWQIARAGLAEHREENRTRSSTGRTKGREPMVQSLLSDLRFAIRSHARKPGIALLAIATLALGVGASTAIFSVVNGVLLRPLPYPDSNDIVSIQVNSGMGSSEGFYDLSEPELLDFESQVSSFSHVAGYEGREVTLGDSASTRRIRVVRSTASLFPLLGIEPVMGRTFTPGEDAPGAERLAVLSQGMWRRDYGGDPQILGRTITMDGEPVTVIGVMGPEFEFPTPGWDAYSQLMLDREDPWARNNHYLPTVARLTPGNTLQRARSEVTVLAARATETYPEFYPNAGLRIQLQTYRESMVGAVKTPLYVLLAAVGFVLLTACVNVANLLLARGETRRRELAIRTAMGASAGRVRKQLLTESFMLAALGGMGGLGLAIGGIDLLLALAPEALPRLNEIGIDITVLGFSILAALTTGVVFGIVPGIQPTRRDVQETLKEGGGERGTTRGSHLLRRTLVIAQVMLAVVLVTGSGLMLRTVMNMYRVDKGFETENILTFRINPATQRYETPEERVGLYQELMPRLEALPGVVRAGAANSPPMTSRNNNWSILIEGRPVANIGEAPADLVQRVTPGYFETLGMTLVRGRLFTEADDAGAPPVVVISEAMAEKHWPGEDAIGMRMKVFSPDWPWIEVIGIVKDVRHQGPAEDPRPRWYVPHAQAYRSAYAAPLATTMVVRSTGDPQLLLGTIRGLMADFDGSIPISDVRTMDQILSGVVARERFTMTLLTIFGALALFLAVVGVYGVVSYSVSQRTREIGLRKALGAAGGNVLARVLREGVILSVVGVGMGLAGSLFLSRTFEALVFGVSATDPATYAVVAAVLVAAATLASFVPAWRASRVSPMVAMREE